MFCAADVNADWLLDVPAFRQVIQTRVAHHDLLADTGTATWGSSKCMLELPLAQSWPHAVYRGAHVSVCCLTAQQRYIAAQQRKS